nr:MAG TPA: hypothetical protein [Bacteriophage sp.]
MKLSRFITVYNELLRRVYCSLILLKNIMI